MCPYCFHLHLNNEINFKIVDVKMRERKKKERKEEREEEDCDYTTNGGNFSQKNLITI